MLVLNLARKAATVSETNQEPEPLVRWGIIGAGRIAQGAMAPAIMKSGSGVLLAVASRDAGRAAEIADTLDVERAYLSYDELLGDPDVDVVYIGLPNGLHEQWAIAAARAGKHVLCEKSLAFDRAAALRMRHAFAEAGCFLVEGYMYRHHPQWRVVLNWLRSGRIGTLRAIDARFTNPLADENDHRWSAELGRGCLFDLTCYTVNVARYISGEEPTRLSAIADWRSPGVDQSTLVSMQFPSGLMATGMGSFVTHPSQSLVIYGTEGRVEIDKPFIPGTDAAVVRLFTSEGEKVHEVPGADHFAKQIRRVNSCVQQGSVGDIPVEDGVANVTVLEAVARAAEEGISLTLDESLAPH